MDGANFGESWESGALTQAVLVAVIGAGLAYPMRGPVSYGFNALQTT